MCVVFLSHFQVSFVELSAVHRAVHTHLTDHQCQYWLKKTTIFILVFWSRSTCHPFKIVCGPSGRSIINSLAWFQQASVCGPRKPNQPMSSLRAPSSRSRSLRTRGAACGHRLSMRGRPIECTLMDHSFRASSRPTLRRAGSRRTLSWT